MIDVSTFPACILGYAGKGRRTVELAMTISRADRFIDAVRRSLDGVAELCGSGV